MYGLPVGSPGAVTVHRDRVAVVVDVRHQVTRRVVGDCSCQKAALLSARRESMSQSMCSEGDEGREGRSGELYGEPAQFTGPADRVTTSARR